MHFNDLPRFTRNPSYRVTITWDYLLDQIQRWSQEHLCPVNLDPDFQRPHVWTPAQQTAYVEYILKGGASGKEIYFNCAGWQNSYKGPFVLVDGKQRLQAATAFLKNELPIFGGYLCKDIEGRIPHNALFYFNVNDLNTRAEVLRWYLEMNTGGTPHTDSEIQKVQDMLNTEENPK